MTDNVKGGGLSLGALAAVGLVLLVAIGLIALGGGLDLGAGQDRQAQRIQARADLELARAEADAERAETRQAERDAAQARALVWLPYLVAIGGGVLVAALVILVFWDLRATRAAPPATIPPALLAYLQDRDQAMWRAIAAEQRRRLPEASGPVVIYDSGANHKG